MLAAKMAHDCGADGVDFKLCHGYLGSQLLRPFNDRKWKYGGSWGNRTRFAYEFYERVAKEIKDPGFIVGSKISIWEGLPGRHGLGGPRTRRSWTSRRSLDLVQGPGGARGQVHHRVGGNPSLTLALTQPDKNDPGLRYLHFWFQKQLRKALKPETVVIGSAYSMFRDGKNPFRGVKREESSFTYWANKNIRDGVLRHGRHRAPVPGRPAPARQARGGPGRRDRVVHRLRQLHRVPHPAEAGRVRHPREGVHAGAASRSGWRRGSWPRRRSTPSPSAMGNGDTLPTTIERISMPSVDRKRSVEARILESPLEEDQLRRPAGRPTARARQRPRCSA